MPLIVPPETQFTRRLALLQVGTVNFCPMRRASNSRMFSVKHIARSHFKSNFIDFRQLASMAFVNVRENRACALRHAAIAHAIPLAKAIMLRN
jgi:hypothetical protein